MPVHIDEVAAVPPGREAQKFCRWLLATQLPAPSDGSGVSAQHREAFSGRRVPQWLVYGICGCDDLLHGLLQKALLKGCDGHFAQNRKKIFVQCVRIICIGGFFYTVLQRVQPCHGQCFKGQVGSIQIVKARLGFPLNQHPFDLHIGRSVDVVPLDFASLCTRFDIAAFPSTVLALANAFSPSRHRCFLLLFRPSSDPLFSPSSFTAGIIIQNWAKNKNNPAFAMFFQGQM